MKFGVREGRRQDKILKVNMNRLEERDLRKEKHGLRRVESSGYKEKKSIP